MERHVILKTDTIDMKKVTLQLFCFHSFFLLMWFFCSFNTDNADYINGYYKPYMDSSYNFFEIGYRVLSILSYKVGINFFVFRMVLMTVFLLLIANSILAYSEKPLFIAMLFFCFPFLVECVQIRNAISMALIIYALRYLAWNNLKGLIIYIIFVITATLFHKSAVVYLLFILAYKNSIKTVWKFTFVIFTGSYLMILFFGDQVLHWLYELTGEYRLLYYMGLNEGRIFGKGMLPFLLVGLILFYLCSKSKVLFQTFKNVKMNKMDMLLLNVSVITLSFIPLYLIDGNYIRLCSFMLPVTYSTLINMAEYCNMSKFRKFAIYIFCICLSGILFVFYIGPLNYSMFEGVTKAVFYNNALWEWLMY